MHTGGRPEGASSPDVLTHPAGRLDAGRGAHTSLPQERVIAEKVRVKGELGRRQVSSPPPAAEAFQAAQNER